MKTIRNKTVNQTIRKYLLDNMDFSGYVGYFEGMDTEPKTDTEKTLALWKIFQSEKGWEVDRIGKQASFINWLQGLASAMTVDFTYYDQMRLMSTWFDVDEDTALEMAKRGDFWKRCTTVYFEMLADAQKAAA